MKTGQEFAATFTAVILALIFGLITCLYLWNRHPKPPTPLEVAKMEAKACGGRLSTNGVVFLCDFLGEDSAKVYYFQHNGKDHYVAVGRHGEIAIK